MSASYATKRDVDRYVTEIEDFFEDETDRALKGLTIAKLYFNVGSYYMALVYLNSYDSVRKASSSSFKLRGQVFEALSSSADESEKSYLQALSLQAYQKSYDNENDIDVLQKICDLILQLSTENKEKTQPWLDRIERDDPKNPILNRIRSKINGKTEPEDKMTNIAGNGYDFTADTESEDEVYFSAESDDESFDRQDTPGSNPKVQVFKIQNPMAVVEELLVTVLDANKSQKGILDAIFLELNLMQGDLKTLQDEREACRKEVLEFQRSVLREVEVLREETNQQLVKNTLAVEEMRSEVTSLLNTFLMSGTQFIHQTSEDQVELQEDSEEKVDVPKLSEEANSTQTISQTLDSERTTSTSDPSLVTPRSKERTKSPFTILQNTPFEMSSWPFPVSSSLFTQSSPVIDFVPDSMKQSSIISDASKSTVEAPIKSMISPISKSGLIDKEPSPTSFSFSNPESALDHSEHHFQTDSNPGLLLAFKETNDRDKIDKSVLTQATATGGIQDHSLNFSVSGIVETESCFGDSNSSETALKASASQEKLLSEFSFSKEVNEARQSLPFGVYASQKLPTFAEIAAQGSSIDTPKEISFTFSGTGSPVFDRRRSSAANSIDDQRGSSFRVFDSRANSVSPLPALVEMKPLEGDEEELFGSRGKAYRFDSECKEWKERGIGKVQILVHSSKGTFRVLLRRESVHKIAINHSITKHIELNPMIHCSKALCYYALDFSDEDLRLEHLAVRFQKQETLEQFKKVFEMCQSKLP